MVIALKAMQMDVMNGGKVLEKLASSAIWASYKDQKHDLFLEVVLILVLVIYSAVWCSVVWCDVV